MCCLFQILANTKQARPECLLISYLLNLLARAVLGNIAQAGRFRISTTSSQYYAGRPSRSISKGHVTRSNLSCNLQLNKRCVANCKKKFTCNTPFYNCNCCVASCKKSKTTLYFSQRCETSCLRVTSPVQLATQFYQNGPIRAHLSQDVGDLARAPSCLLLYALQVAKKVANV